MEGGGRVRRCGQIVIGDYNSFTQGCWLWPDDSQFDGVRIRIGNTNYFNRNVMLDACGIIEIGNQNMVGPDTYITDSNHTMDAKRWVGECPMDKGRVIVGNGCWIGAKATILRNVVLGDRCIVAAGAVVTQSFRRAQWLVEIPPDSSDGFSCNPQKARGDWFNVCISNVMKNEDTLRALVAQLTAQPPERIAMESWPTHYGLDSLSILIFREECEKVFNVLFQTTLGRNCAPSLMFSNL